MAEDRTAGRAGAKPGAAIRRKKKKPGFLRRLLAMPFLHSDGRPRKWLYRLLFHRNGAPCRRTRFLVQNRAGRPRIWFRRWLDELTRKRLLASGGLDVPILWFFMGDTLDWLSSHEHVTGVGRVTTELFIGGLDGARPPLWYPAVAGGSGVRAWRPPGADRKRKGKVKAAVDNARPANAALRALLDRVPSPHVEPKAGDHVLFTGVVWNAHYVNLFRKITGEGLTFSVLVHDIIPILDPSLSEPRALAEFTEWLDVVMSKAQMVFVSCASVRADIEQWCAARGIERRAPIVVIPFGPSLAPAAAGRTELRDGIAAPYVLSVGTIDRRKNQVFLCRVWRRLLDEKGGAQLPMLVLVGRDDLDLARSADVAALRAAGRIALLSDVNDDELDRLYRDCLFTAFPSTMEGYGLPVADSLAYGKLPVTSDLAPIRDYAGDLPFYFDPRDEDGATRVFRRAIENGEERAAAEQRIAAWRPGSWSAAADALYRPLMLALAARAGADKLLPGLRHGLTQAQLHERARPWCSPTPDVSILVINWNAAAMTRLCIEHIWAHTQGLTYEILIADNGSRRSDLALLSDVGPGVRLYPLGVNRFFGEANNIIAEKARGRLLCLLNNDVFVSPGWLETLVRELEGNPDIGAAGPVFLFPDNTVQEAGGRLGPSGIPDRQLRGEPAEAIAGHVSQDVDYISAAGLVMRRETFFEAGGFDLAFEPAYYEDTDLCFKLAALGLRVRLCPSVTVVHLEGYSINEEALPSQSKKALGDLNRAKFLARWGAYLEARDPAELAKARARFMPRPAGPAGRHARRALLYTAYNLTPGGGERYLLTIAAALTADHEVTLATPHPYSRLRLNELGTLFGLDLSACRLVTEPELEAQAPFDVMVTMGNFVLPPIGGLAARNFYHCQFPFRPGKGERFDPETLANYEAFIVNSGFTRAAVESQLYQRALPDRPVHVAYPPVPHYRGDADAKKPIILNVGRFFVGGHAKRQDRLIEAFRVLRQRVGGEVELHLAGSSTPGAEHMDYLRELQDLADGLPVVFHVNCSTEELDALYRDAAIYWHGTGLGADLVGRPELAEHFGIAIVEAMSAQCVAFALKAGGAPEIIHDGVDGFLYEDEAELVVRTAELLSGPVETRVAIGRRAGDRAAAFAPERFTSRIRELVSWSPASRD
ncbi:glycosyltransferase [Ancylobacter sp. G4_0304]|uniref:glycosyltransferase n=1 Tax=Ancylobacter sp. G4_0304 TaxID=3114289 RepID=UPI0039C66E56